MKLKIYTYILQRYIHIYYKDIYIYILRRYIFVSISICIIIKSIQWNMIPVYREFIYLCVNIDAVPRHIIVQIGNVCSCNLANKRHVKALFDACLSYANMSVKRRRCCNSCVLASQSEMRGLAIGMYPKTRV